MFNSRQKWLSAVVAASLMVASASSMAEDKTLHVYNWSDYISPDTVPNFEKQSGIKVVYDVFDSNEVLEGKLMAGSTGYDVVVPSSSFLARQLQSGVFQPLDKSKLPNYKNLDPELMQKVAQHDPDNKYAIPYLWGTTGIGYNVEKVKAALGTDAPVNSWDLVLKPENLEKLKSCGVSFLDAPEEIFATVLNYLGKDPNSSDAKDYSGAATDLLLKLRPSIRYFHSSQYINDLANGNTCVAIGWSGDILQAKNRAEQAKNGVHLAYSVPKEGALAFFDMMAIPKDAKNLDAAYQWLNYLGKDPNSSDAKDYSGAATDLLLKLRPNIRYFHSSQYINDLANGNICVAIGWSGDILQAKNRADAAKNGVHLGYSVPKEGALAFFDMMAIPKDAKNIDGAYAWLNYIMDPKVIADVSNKMNYANGNKASLPLINADVRNNPGIFPTPDAMAKLYVRDPVSDPGP